MKIHSLINFAASFYILFFNYLVYFKNKKSKVNISFAIFGLSIFLWLFSFGMAYHATSQELKLFWFKNGYVGIIFMPVCFYVFVHHLLEIKKDSLFRVICILLGFVFVFIVFSKGSFIIGLYEYPWGFYPKIPIIKQVPFLIFFNVLFSLSIIKLVFALLGKNTSYNSIQRNRIRYVFIGSIFGVLGAVDYLAAYGINIFPFGFVFMILYPLILTYAIIRYRLMDISIAITRTGIFIAVYSIVLGIPFAIAFGLQEKLKFIFGLNWWIVPLAISTLLATAGPFLYLYIQKRAEDRILQEQRQYQSTLRQASSGMGRIKDLKKLLNMIVYIITRTVRIEHCLVYVYDNSIKKYFLGGARNKKFNSKSNGTIELNSPLIHYFSKSSDPLVYEEIKQKMQDFKDPQLNEIEKYLNYLDAAVVVPSFIEKRLLGLLVLGKKKSGKLYSQDDLAVFSILANQAALAIENAQFYEDMKKTHEQLFKAEKMATIGTMADGLSHQINNRLHALGFIAGDAMDSLKIKSQTPLSPDMKEFIGEMEHALKRIQDNVKQGGEIVQGLLKYTRKGEQGFAAVDLDQLITASFEMAQFKIKLNQLKVIKEYTNDTPKIRGNFTQLQEVFFNLIDNAYDAMMQRKSEKNEPGYQPTLRITANRNDGQLEINVIDNGIGVKKEDAEKLFTPFFTTKLSSKKGTGLGLYVLQKIIEENHGGKVVFNSEYMQGTNIIVRLPISE